MLDEAKIAEVIKKTTPLTETTFYVLVALKEPLHGYGIMQKIGEISHNRVQLGPGTLYGALSNLQNIGLIAAVGETGADRRKLYSMTALGQRVAEYEVQRFEELARHGRQLLGL